MPDSGTTGKSTSGDAAVTLIATGHGKRVTRVIVVNEGAAAGFVSIDGGTTKHRIPGAAAATSPVARVVNLTPPRADVAVTLYRVPSGTDMSGVYASTE